MQIPLRAYDISGSRWMRDLLQDFRYTIRTIRRRPAFAAIAILTLALAIGSCTAVFSLIEAVLLRSLPYGNPERLVYLYTPNSHLDFPPEAFGPSYADFFDLLRENQSFKNMSIFEQAQYSLSSRGFPISVGGARVDDNFFSTLQVHPELGRVIDTEDTVPGHNHVVVISDGLWKDAFGSTADILHKSLILDHGIYQIIGVMPAEFGYPQETDFPFSEPGISSTQIWLPLSLGPQLRAQRDDSNAFAIARLKEDVSMQQAQAEISALMVRLDGLHRALRGWSGFVKSFRDSTLGPVRRLMWSLFGAVTLVLLIACANAATLLFRRALEMRRELAIRAALGAEQCRLLRQLLSELLLLGTGAALVGIGLAKALLQVVLKIRPPNIPRIGETHLDRHVLLFAILAGLLATVVAGIAPALSTSRTNLVDHLKGTGIVGFRAGRDRGRSAAITCEVAFVVILLVGAVLLIRSYLNIEAIHAGFSLAPLSANIHLDSHYRTSSERSAFWQSAVERMGQDNAIGRAGVVSSLPLSSTNNFIPFAIEGLPFRENQLVETRVATSGYFSIMGIPLEEGDYYKDSETHTGLLPVMVNEAFIKKYLMGRYAIGQHLKTGGDRNPWMTVVGVVGDVRHARLEQMPAPEIYQPLWEDPPESAFLVVRAAGVPREVAARLRSLLSDVDPNLALAQVHTLGELRTIATSKRRFQTSLLTAFALIALLIAMAGLYGLLSYEVRQRTNEIGVRMVVGSSRGRILMLILGQGLRLVLCGLLIGIAGSLVLARVVKGFLYGVPASDPITLLGVSCLLMLVSAGACLVPGWRAASMDAARALREE